MKNIIFLCELTDEPSWPGQVGVGGSLESELKTSTESNSE